MDNKERLYKLIEELQLKLEEGWEVDIISVGRFTGEYGSPMLSVELVLERK